jgi:hypothetical protein
MDIEVRIARLPSMTILYVNSLLRLLIRCAAVNYRRQTAVTTNERSSAISKAAEATIHVPIVVYTNGQESGNLSPRRGDRISDDRMVRLPGLGSRHNVAGVVRLH